MIAEMIAHVPVLLEEAIGLLQVRCGGTYVDCTVGSGGHAEHILSRLQGHGFLLALDRDRDALERARERLSARFQNVQFCPENFKNLPQLLRNLEIERIDGCLVDLGVSACQLETAERGFSFRHDGPLDMRMDTRQPVTAEQMVNQLSVDQLAEIFRCFGEEPHSFKIARAIVEERKKSRFCSTRQLANLVAAVKGSPRGSRTHPATRVFQALRIAVNEELEGLEAFLSQVITWLSPKGRLVVISFHSLEDRIVKSTFRLESGRCTCFKPRELCCCPRVRRIINLTRKPLVPTQPEVEANPRARSAKLRAIEKVSEEQASERIQPHGGSQSPKD